MVSQSIIKELIDASIKGTISIENLEESGVPKRLHTIAKT